jgi:hypothetical protein
MELVVPKRKQTLPRMPGYRKTETVGVTQPMVLIDERLLLPKLEAVHIGAMDHKSRPGFTKSRNGQRFSAISDDRQTLQQGGSNLGNRSEQPTGSRHNQDKPREERSIQRGTSNHPHTP